MMWRGYSWIINRGYGMTCRVTYLGWRKTCEQLPVRMQGNKEKQKVAIGKMAAADLLEVAGFEMLGRQMKLK